MTPITLEYPTGSTNLYAYYVGRTLASYVADKVLFVERSAPDLGIYDATVDETKGTSLRLFVGATQPASWADAVVGVGWDLLLAAFKADADLGTATGGLVANVLQSKDIAEADPIIELSSGVQVLRTYKRGTSDELIPAKAAKQPGGAALTNPATQQLAGFRETP